MLKYRSARVVELVDTHALGACAEMHAGSSPVPGTRSGLFGKFSRVSAFLFNLWYDSYEGGGLWSSSG